MALAIPKSIIQYIDNDLTREEACKQTAQAYEKLFKGDPLVSIVMPAYNESENIIRALSSLCLNKTDKSVEIIVVNNNSSDDTEKLVISCGVRCIFEKKQGITFARNAGLSFSRGKYILNADADVIYPEHWIDEMINPLIDNVSIGITYGRFSFIPVGRTGRSVYYFYEKFASLARLYNKIFKDEAVNVYGFNSAFRRDDGIKVDGFHHPPGSNEDGYLALKIRENGLGRLFCVTKSRALVWTTDRRIQIDGGIYKGMILRLKRTFNLR